MNKHFFIPRELNKLYLFHVSLQIVFSARLDATERATFRLRYEEQLPQDSKGSYTYEFIVDPSGQVINEFSFQITLNETRPLKDISVFKELSSTKTKNEITAQTLTFDKTTKPYFATVNAHPEQDGSEWKLILNYDVDRAQNGNEIQIGAGKHS